MTYAINRIIVSIVLVLAAAAGRPAEAAGNVPLPVGATAPAIDEPTARGTFDSTTSSKPFLIEFFAVWCQHCQREVPVMNELQRVDGDRIDVIAIPASPFGFDKQSVLQQADIDTFADRFAVNYRIGFDGFFSSVYDYGLTSFPTFYVVDASRHVVAVEAGEVPFAKLHADVTAAVQAGVQR